MRRDRIRLWISTNLHLLAFLGAYFLTTVAGNLIFRLAFGPAIAGGITLFRPVSGVLTHVHVSWLTGCRSSALSS